MLLLNRNDDIFLVYNTINDISLEAIFIIKKKKKFKYLEQFCTFCFVHTYIGIYVFAQAHASMHIYLEMWIISMRKTCSLCWFDVVTTS